MLIHHLALTATAAVHPSELAAVAAAVQTQLLRDVGVAWNVRATVTPFTDPRAVPAGYWPITVCDALDEPDALGYHSDENRQPYAMVEFTDEWPITVSHEACEMACDPYGNSLTPPVSFYMAGREIVSVRVLREVCDPPEARSYKIHGIQVSDFCLPGYFHELAHQVDAMHALSAPLTLLPGGYLSWVTEAGRWEQGQWFGGPAPVIADLGPASARPREMSLREWSDWNARQAKAEVMRVGSEGAD